MDILRIAKEAGMQVILDARIGREEYKSVIGTVEALQRFVDALGTGGDQGRLENPAAVE